jgi:hypothetical protein
MKVFNLTDVETPKLKQHKLLNQTLSIGGSLVAPGGSVEDRMHARHGLSVGALAVDDLPVSYVKAKEIKPQVVVKIEETVVVTDALPVSRRNKSGSSY